MFLVRDWQHSKSFGLAAGKEYINKKFSVSLVVLPIRYSFSDVVVLFVSKCHSVQAASNTAISDIRNDILKCVLVF